MLPATALRRSAVGAVALLAGAAGLGLATQHPVAPGLASGLWLAAALLVAWQPRSWLFWFPAALPLLNFSPWTGWWLLDESDLAVLAILAGGWARWAASRHAGTAAWPGWRGPQGLGWLCLALALSAVAGVWRGLVDAGGLALDGRAALAAGLYAGYDAPWNTLRVAKSLLWALLLLPLLRHRPRPDAPPAAQWLARGMVAGLLLTGLVVLLERHLYTGLFDFSRTYRTTAWFWEMHVGGGAIDAYLALAAPFALWALWTAPPGWRWWAAQALLALTVYAVLTTYSRGVYLATLIALTWMAFSAWRWRLPARAGPRWGRRAWALVALVLLAEGAAVLGGGAFMGERLAQANTDLLGRVGHWRAGLSLLKTPSDAALGIGWGRLPAQYSRSVPGGELAGQARWGVDPAGRPHVLLAGPATRAELAPLFALTQRVPLDSALPYTVRLQGQVQQPVQLQFSLCVRHLLYSEQCQTRQWRAAGAAAGPDGWQPVELQARLHGPAFTPAQWRGGSLRGVWSVSVLGAGEQLRLQSLTLHAPDGAQLLRNPAFTDHLQHWLPAARGHFQPWHLDNLYLETLVERGLLGLLVLGAWVALVAGALWQRLAQGDVLAWGYLASLLGLCALGLVISVLELPRVALLGFLVLWAAHPATAPGVVQRPDGRAAPG
jgi:hypothetical protein